MLPGAQFFGRRVVLFPVLGKFSWLPTAALIYVGIYIAIKVVSHFSDLLLPAFPTIKNSLAGRTGVFRLDPFGFRLSLLATVLFLATDWTLVPLGMAGLLAFADTNSMPVVLREVGSSRRVVLSRAPSEDADDSDGTLVPRRFQWRMDRGSAEPLSFDIELPVSRRRYADFKEANPFGSQARAAKNFGFFVLDGATKEIAELAARMMSISREFGFSSFEEIANTLAFVQSINYASDKETKGKQYYRFPIETLYEQVGDSDCKSILFASLMKAMDYQVIILEGHARLAVGVAAADTIPGRFLDHDGRRYYYCETTKSGWHVGEIPSDLASERFRVTVL